MTTFGYRSLEHITFEHWSLEHRTLEQKTLEGNTTQKIRTVQHRPEKIEQKTLQQ